MVSCAALLSGCTGGGSFGVNTLLRPPRTTGDKAQIQDIISSEAGGAYTLKYPKNGDNRSAVIMRKMENRNKTSSVVSTDSENSQNKGSSEYAVAFYSTENDTKLNVSFIMYDDKEWKCKGTFTSSGIGIDRVIFEDIDGNGIDEIIIGWTTYDTNKKILSAYSLENNTIQEMKVDETYNDILVADITGDNRNDIVLLSLSSANTPAQAKMLQYADGDKRLVVKSDPVLLDAEITEFTNVTYGKIDSRKNGLVIDGKKTGDITRTQIVYFDDNLQALVNPLLMIADDGTISNETTRRDKTLAKDLDGDGIIEVPVVNQMAAAVDERAANIGSLTAWKQFSVADNTLNTKMETVINYNDGYYVVMPDKWENGSVTARLDTDKRQLTFYAWDKNASVVGDKLLVIYRYTTREWDNVDKRALMQLDDVKIDSKVVLAAQICYCDDQKNLNITEKEVQKNTHALTTN